MRYIKEIKDGDQLNYRIRLEALMLRFGIQIQMELRTLQAVTLSACRDRFPYIWEPYRVKLLGQEDAVRVNTI